MGRYDPMESVDGEASTAASPLELFVRSYVETTGGAWDEVEPQVYDLVVPASRVRSNHRECGSQLVTCHFRPRSLAGIIPEA